MIWRYKINGSSLELCETAGRSVLDFVKTNYPNAANVKKNEAAGDISITLFDDEVFKMLSKIPDNETYWECDSKFERVP